KVLDGVATVEHGVHVFVEHRSVEAIAAKAAAHEKGTAPAQDGAHNRQVQVDAGGNVGDHQAVMEQYIGEQQVVDVTAVAGNIDNSVFLGSFLGNLDIVDAHPVVDPVPDSGQQNIEEADAGNRHVRDNLVCVFPGAFPGLGRCNIVALRGFADSIFHDRADNQGLDQGPTVREVWTNHRLAHPAEVDSQNPRHLAGRQLFGLDPFSDLTQGNGFVELNIGVSAVDQNNQQFLQSAGNRPGIGKQQLQQ